MKTYFSRLSGMIGVAVLIGAAFAQVPKDAVPIGPFFSAPGIDGVAVQLAVITSVQTQIENQNASATQNFSGACGNWTIASLHSREMGLTLAPKPVPSPRQIVGTYQKDKNSPVYVWMTDGPPVGVCPDLPPVPPPPPAGNTAIGVHIYGAYWQSLPADTMPDGAKVTTTSTDGTTGTFQKVMYPFGGWWLKLQ